MSNLVMVSKYGVPRYLPNGKSNPEYNHRESEARRRARGIQPRKPAGQNKYGTPRSLPDGSSNPEYTKRYGVAHSPHRVIRSFGKLDKTTDAFKRNQWKYNLWSTEEDSSLRKLFGSLTYEEIAKHLGRTYNEVKYRIYMLGLRKKPLSWSKEEITMLRKEVASGMAYKDIAIILKRPIGALELKVMRIGLRRYGEWTNEEKGLLQKLYPKYLDTGDFGAFKKNFMGKSRGSITGMAFQLGLTDHSNISRSSKRWSAAHPGFRAQLCAMAREARRFKRPTSIEISLEKALKAAGIEFIINSKLLGHPDFEIITHGVVVFADGCYWHACLKCFPNGPILPAGLDFRKRRKTDKNITKALQEQGIVVLRFWEHDLRTLKGLTKAVRVVSGLTAKRLQTV